MTFFLMTHEFDLLWDFHGVQENAMKYIQIFHGVQIHGNLMDGKFMGHVFPPNEEFLMDHEDSQSTFLTFSQYFYGSWSVFCAWSWHFHGLK